MHINGIGKRILRHIPSKFLPYKYTITILPEDSLVSGHPYSSGLVCYNVSDIQIENLLLTYLSGSVTQDIQNKKSLFSTKVQISVMILTADMNPPLKISS